MKRSLCALAFLLPSSLALACEVPGDATKAVQRALAKVKQLPETEAWQAEKRKAGEPVQFRLLLEKEAYFNRKCHWTIEAVAKNELWRRFYVSPDGDSLLIDYATSQPVVAAPPKPRRPAAPKAARP
ncbi:MAG TPA: hypothetical protein VNH12_11105 [Burkholderiales bacterium]|nr:hypothetical protein [Burkholderiales bacterium]